MTQEPHRWKFTIAKVKADKARLRLFLSDLQKDSSLTFHPSFACVFLHRVSRHFLVGGHSLLARFIGHFNEVLTGADISPESDIDGGLVILSPAGTALNGKAGKNLMIMPCSGIGGEIGRREDVGAGVGLPVLGDDVILEPHSGVLGPARIGNRVRVSAGVLVTRDVPDDSVVEGPRPRIFTRKQAP
jgi:serine O-acetyltransferase